MKRGLKTLIAGILLIAVGAFVVPVLFILPILTGSSNEQQFLIPGSTEVEIEEPGRYYLWNDYQTVYQGKSYHLSEDIPNGLEFLIQDESGRALSFISSKAISSSSGSSAKNSIGYIELENPGKLTLTVSGDTAQRVFSFSQFGIMKILGLIFGGLAASVLVTLSGLGILIWGIVKLANNKNEQNTAASG